MTTIGKNITRLREKAGLNSWQFEITCFPNASLWRLDYETGERIPSAKHIMRMTEVLKCDWREFFDGIIRSNGPMVMSAKHYSAEHALYLECLKLEREQQMSQKDIREEVKYTTIGNNIEKLMKANGLTLEEFAAAINKQKVNFPICDTRVSQLLDFINSRCYPSRQFICAMVTVLGCSVESLFRDTDPEVIMGEYRHAGSSVAGIWNNLQNIIAEKGLSKKGKPEMSEKRTVADNITQIVRESSNGWVWLTSYMDGFVSVKDIDEHTHYYKIIGLGAHGLIYIAGKLGIDFNQFFLGVPRDEKTLKLYRECLEVPHKSKEEKERISDKEKEKERQEKENETARVSKENELKEKARAFEIACRNAMLPFWGPDGFNRSALKYVNKRQALIDCMRHRHHASLHALIKSGEFDDVLTNNENEILFEAMKNVLRHPYSDGHIKDFALIISNPDVHGWLDNTVLCDSRLEEIKQKVIEGASFRNVRDMSVIFFTIYYEESSTGKAIVDAMIKDILEG